MSNAKSDPHQRSKEHILGKCVAKELPKTTHLNGSTSLICEKPLKGNTQPQFITSHSVCRTCNGRLGDEIDLVKDLIVGMCLGRLRRTFNLDDQNLLLRYFQRMSIIRDVDASDRDLSEYGIDKLEYAKQFGSSHMFPPIISDKDRKEFLSGSTLSAISVFIGQTKWWGGRNRLVLIEDVPFNRPMPQLRARRFQIFIERLAIRVHVGNILGDNIGSFIRIDGNSELSWPPRSVVDADQIYSSIRPNEEYEFVRHQFRNRRNRRRMISEFRKTGCWNFDPNL